MNTADHDNSDKLRRGPMGTSAALMRLEKNEAPTSAACAALEKRAHGRKEMSLAEQKKASMAHMPPQAKRSNMAIPSEGA